jgi:hypothetical protein
MDSTSLTKLLGCKHPVMLAGMKIAGPELAAAVSNAGGIGTIGGVTLTPEELKDDLDLLKSKLNDPSLPFGVDLLLPQVGGGARETNHDYTEGRLPELVDTIISSGAKLFVSAVGVPPRWVVQKLHKAGVVCMNIVGSPKHVPKALESGADLICAQGGEAGGHTGEIPTSLLIPACVDLPPARVELAVSWSRATSLLTRRLRVLISLQVPRARLGADGRAGRRGRRGRNLRRPRARDGAGARRGRGVGRDAIRVHARVRVLRPLEAGTPRHCIACAPGSRRARAVVWNQRTRQRAASSLGLSANSQAIVA